MDDFMDYGVGVLIAQVVAKDISDALDVAPKYPHQATFAIPYYQNQLVVRVIREVLNHYFVDPQDDRKKQVEALVYFLREPANVKGLIQESFVSVLEENVDWTQHVYIPDSVPPLCELCNFVS